MKVRRHTSDRPWKPRNDASDGAEKSGSGRFRLGTGWWRPGSGWFRPGKWLGALSRGYDMRLFAATFVSCLIIGYFIAALFLFPAPFFAKAKAVPDLNGMQQDEAEEALQGAGLVPGDAETISHPTAAAGDVVWQDPPAGMVVPEGTPIQIAVSQGPQQIPVPDVVNYTAELARLLLESAGLTPDLVDVQTPLPRGEVENTRPRAGVPLEPGDTVRVLVSIGPANVAMPDLAGMTLEQARDTLEALGLVLGDFFPATSRAQAPGMIFQQQPPAGTLTAQGTVVTGRTVRENQ